MCALVVRDPDQAVITAATRRPALSEEEQEQRRKDAEELERKLQHITEKIPTRIMNTSGSNAGAGSGEFHMYRMARRREMMRLQRIDEDAKQQEQLTAFEEKQQRLRAEDDQRTAKNRSKRLKRKAKHKGGAPEQPGTAEGRGVPAEDAQPELD